MFDYYCKKCDKVCKSDDVELREGFIEGDFEETHIDCGSEVQILF